MFMFSSAGFEFEFPPLLLLLQFPLLLPLFPALFFPLFFPDFSDFFVMVSSEFPTKAFFSPLLKISFHRFEAVRIGFPAEEVIDAELFSSDSSRTGPGPGSGSASGSGSGFGF
uniref:Uncharacterized protein n=1 Tax=Opuntia streptacantha TaxID=393608 RepID=A0A7C9D998_OPUST